MSRVSPDDETRIEGDPTASDDRQQQEASIEFALRQMPLFHLLWKYPLLPLVAHLASAVSVAYFVLETLHTAPLGPLREGLWIILQFSCAIFDFLCLLWYMQATDLRNPWDFIEKNQVLTPPTPSQTRI